MALTLVTSDLIHGLDYSKLTGTITTWNQNTTGNAATATLAAGATILATARNIGGVSFNGSAAIDLPGVNAAGNQPTSGNAGTVTNGVYTVGNQTIGGTKTFSNSITAPTLIANGAGVFTGVGRGAAYQYADMTNTGGRMVIGVESSVANVAFGGSTAYSTNFGSANATDVCFVTNNQNRLTISSGGNLGIGTTSPGAKLHNYSTATNNVFITGYGTAAQNDWQAQNAFFVKTDNGILISKENANNNTNRLFNFYNNASAEAEMYMYRGGSTSYIKLDTNGDSYLNGGNVGIGTTSPQRPLHIKKGGSDAGIIRIENTGSGNHVAGIELISGHGSWGIYNSDTVGDAFEIRDDSANATRLLITSTGDVQVKGIDASSTPALGVTQSDGDYLAKLHVSSADGFLSLYTGQSTPLEKVRISSYGNSWFIPNGGGNLGIGETNPVNKLEVNGTFAAPLTSGSAQNGIARFSQTLGDGCLDIGFGDPYTWLQSRNSTSYSTTYYLALNPTGGNVLIGATTRLSGYNAHNIIHTSQSGYACIISQQDINTSNNSVLQLNRAEVNATTQGYCLIYRQGNASSGTNRFIVFANGNVQNSNNSYGQLSDIKLKENVADATPKLNDLLKVKVKNFNFIGENTKQIGVIAQELEKIFPSMIDESPDTEDREVTDEEGNVTNEKVDLGTVTKSVKYSVFTPMLIKAIQEQQAQIELLKQEVELLKQ